MAQLSFTQQVASNVRAEMARSRTTQQSLARKIATSQQSLSRRLSGNQPFDTDELGSIAKALGVKVDSLVADAPRPGDSHQAAPEFSCPTTE
ncbi:helix-turn-helix domain-containing protein [Mycobacteroides abscessus]|uniref:helix-turn-helix domain-containing protein n=2 Tax=Mycobacteroides abscessus TaxID=36809 RepID=UPI0009433140